MVCSRTRMPVFYECQRCTACCRWPGEVRLTDQDVGQLAVFLGLSAYEFTARYTRLRDDRRGLVLTEKANSECVFLQGLDCTVQPVKPQQCRDFPNRWNFPGWEQVCRATPRVVAEAESAAGGVNSSLDPCGGSR